MDAVCIPNCTRSNLSVCILQVKVLLGHRVVQVACGSRDAQTLALTDEGIILLFVLWI